MKQCLRECYSAIPCIKMYETSDYLAVDLISLSAKLIISINLKLLLAVPVNMNTPVFIFLICYMSPMLGAKEYTDAYCFEYDKSNDINCTSNILKGVPCKHPMVPGNTSPPSTVDPWRTWDGIIDPHVTICLRGSFACITYSYIYSNAVQNTSHYCGYTTQQTTIETTSGCASYAFFNMKFKVDSHIIEVCACRSGAEAQPCNITTKQSSSIVTLLSGVVILFYNFI